MLVFLPPGERPHNAHQKEAHPSLAKRAHVGYLLYRTVVGIFAHVWNISYNQLFTLIMKIALPKNVVFGSLTPPASACLIFARR